MTFREQVRFALLWGSGAFALGMLGALFLKLAYADAGVRPADWIVFLTSGLPLVIGAPLLLFGGVLRPIQRWQWHHTIRHSVLWNGYYPRSVTQGWASPFWRWWLHIDREGNDLDARP
jgi:hypothetical protein